MSKRSTKGNTAASSSTAKTSTTGGLPSHLSDLGKTKFNGEYKPPTGDIKPTASPMKGADCLFNLPPHAWSLPISQSARLSGGLKK